MKFLFLWIWAASLLGQVPLINSSTVVVDDISHFSARIQYKLSSGSASQGRIRFTASPAVCTSGKGGTVWTLAWGLEFGSSVVYAQPLFGLSPSTSYQICPEVSADGKRWSTGVGVTITTDPLPQSHPTLPVPAARFNSNYPDTTGYTVVHVPSNDDCSSVRNAIVAAENRQMTQGTMIQVAAGSVCVGSIYLNHLQPDLVHLPPSAFSDTTNHYIRSPSHGLTEGQAVVFFATSAQLFGGPYGGGVLPGSHDDIPEELRSGALPFQTNTPVYVHLNPGDPANSFQIYANAPYGTACHPGHTNSPCPTLWAFDNPGAGATIYAKWPRPLKWIIVRTATPDSRFVPEHVRIQGPPGTNGIPVEPDMWRSKMATFQAPASFLGPYAKGHFLMSTDYDPSGEASYQWMTANIRFVGIEFTYQPLPQAIYSNNPPAGEPLIHIGGGASNIVLDRCWIHGWPPPFRSYRVIEWDGANVGIVDSYLNNLVMPRQFNLGLGVHN